jgi:hypothetical protein
MQEIIKLTYRSDEDAKKSVDEGAFTLVRDNSKFLPEHWNTIVRPWQCVEIRLDSQEEDHFDPFFESGGVGPISRFGTVTESNQTKPSAQATSESVMMPTRYRVNFSYHSKYSHDDTFLESKTWNTPVIIHRSDPNGECNQVLEEIHHITFGAESNARKKRYDISDSGLILGPDDTIKPKKTPYSVPITSQCSTIGCQIFVQLTLPRRYGTVRRWDMVVPVQGALSPSRGVTGFPKAIRWRKSKSH